MVAFRLKAPNNRSAKAQQPCRMLNGPSRGAVHIAYFNKTKNDKHNKTHRRIRSCSFGNRLQSLRGETAIAIF